MSEIVVGIDDSAGAQDALAFAERVARATGATLRLVSVFPYSDVPSRGSVPAYREYLRADAQALLDRAVAATDAPVGTTDAIADMPPAHALHHLCERLDATLVVVGSTRRGPRRRSGRSAGRSRMSGASIGSLPGSDLHKRTKGHIADRFALVGDGSLRIGPPPSRISGTCSCDVRYQLPRGAA